MEKPTRSQDKKENISQTNTNLSTIQSGNGMPPRPNPMITPPTPNSYSSPTIIQTDPSNFKEVVQMLTGSPKTVKSNIVTSSSSKREIPPIPSLQKNKQREGFRIYERRNHHSNPLTLNPVATDITGSSSPSYEGFSPHHIISPSVLDFHQLALSPGDPFNSSSSSSSSQVDEEEQHKAISEKGFYLHPSPPRAEEPPQLLQLFPMTSPNLEKSPKRD